MPQSWHLFPPLLSSSSAHSTSVNDSSGYRCPYKWVPVKQTVQGLQPGCESKRSCSTVHDLDFHTICLSNAVTWRGPGGTGVVPDWPFFHTHFLFIPLHNWLRCLEWQPWDVLASLLSKWPKMRTNYSKQHQNIIQNSKAGSIASNLWISFKCRPMLECFVTETM